MIWWHHLRRHDFTWVADYVAVGYSILECSCGKCLAAPTWPWKGIARLQELRRLM